MPPIVRAGGKFRRILIVVAIGLLAAGAYAFNELGTFLAKEDPLEKADAIFVLAGTELTRPVDGADLYLAGYAPVMVLTRDTLEPAYDALRRRGIVAPSRAERAVDLLTKIGIPREVIVLPDRIHDSTAAEAITLRELAQQYGWHRVIVVTSRFHLRRSGFAMRRELSGTDTQIVMRGSRYDNFEPRRWWSRRSDVRNVMTEVPKLVAYLAGLGA